MNDQDALKSGIRQLGYEVQALQEEANRLKLPDDIPKLIESWMRSAEELPDELPQKPEIIKFLRVALNNFNRGDMQSTRLCILRAKKNFENTGHDKWVMGVQKQYGQNAERQRQINKETVKPKHDLWQEMADNIRSESTRKMSKLEVAREIKKRLDQKNPEKSGAVDYMRKNIDKK